MIKEDDSVISESEDVFLTASAPETNKYQRSVNWTYRVYGMKLVLFVKKMPCTLKDAMHFKRVSLSSHFASINLQ
jgi:hypothetical protein